jgi:hypothetical protein
MTRKLTYLLASVFFFLHGCSFFPSLQQDFSVHSSDPLQVTPATDLDASIELTTVEVNHKGFKVHIAGWRENMIVQNVRLQDASGSMIELETMFLTIKMEGFRFVGQYDLMPAGIVTRPVMAIIAPMIRLYCRKVALETLFWSGCKSAMSVMGFLW